MPCFGLATMPSNPNSLATLIRSDALKVAIADDAEKVFPAGFNVIHELQAPIRLRHDAAYATRRLSRRRREMVSERWLEAPVESCGIDVDNGIRSGREWIIQQVAAN